MAKRVSKSSVNWAFITETFKKTDRQIAISIKVKSDKYLRDLESKPAELPKIDWNLYRSRITAPGMVDLFQKSYEALKIPYPSDQGTLAETEQHNTNMLKFAEKQDAEIKSLIKKYEERVKELSADMRYVDMSMDELYLARPDLRIHPDKPKHWPHTFYESLKAEENEKRDSKTAENIAT